MSASLVGSEMCIRDRPCRVVVYRAAHGAGAARAPYKLRFGLAHTPGSDCLLYTSDAADDM
eukprot:4744962-Alexandrium_andersonii.AAC.1